MNFVKLTNFHGNDPVLVNLDKVCSILKKKIDTDREATVINLSDGKHVTVVESVTQIVPDNGIVLTTIEHGERFGDANIAT